MVDLRPEVGLLTRNVVIQGDQGSEEELFGVHTMAMRSGETLATSLVCRLCDVCPPHPLSRVVGCCHLA